MRLVFITIMFVISSACNQKTSLNESNASGVKELRPNLADSLAVSDTMFKFVNPARIEDVDIPYDEKKMSYLLPELNSVQRSRWTDLINPLSRVKPVYGAYFYARQARKDSLNPIVVFTYTDDYDAMLLLILSRKGRLVDYLQVAGSGICNGEEPDRETGDVRFCDKRFTDFLDDGRFRTFTIKAKKTASKLVKDSIVCDYRLSPLGRIELLKKDSVHLETLDARN